MTRRDVKFGWINKPEENSLLDLCVILSDGT
jgi:hypothetical protein